MITNSLDGTKELLVPWEQTLQVETNGFRQGDLKDSRATTILGSFNAFANRLDDKYFWRNSGSLNLGWQKFKTGTETVDPDFEPVADVLNITSLFGYKLSSKLAASALGEYRTSVIRQFNDPGYLDLGVGFTYTPIKNMVFVFHPINYNFVFAKDDTKFTPSLGCKIVGDYTTEIEYARRRASSDELLSGIHPVRPLGMNRVAGGGR